MLNNLKVKKTGSISSFCLCLTMLLSPLAAAQSMQGPSLGAIFDASAGAIRSLRGIAGSARVGEAIDAGVRLAAAEICSEHSFALGVARDSGKVFLVSFGSGMGKINHVVGVPPNPVRMVLSRGCNAAALVMPQAHRRRSSPAYRRTTVSHSIDSVTPSAPAPLPSTRTEARF